MTGHGNTDQYSPFPCVIKIKGLCPNPFHLIFQSLNKLLKINIKCSIVKRACCFVGFAIFSVRQKMCPVHMAKQTILYSKGKNSIQAEQGKISKVIFSKRFIFKVSMQQP